MIVISANHDWVTNCLSVWVKKLTDFAKKKGFRVTTLEGKFLTLKDFKGKLKATDPKFVFFNCHGTPDSLLDNDGKPFFTSRSCSILSKRIVFARACDTLGKMGKESVKKGCKSFIGYRKKFWLVRSHKRECQPLKDDVAGPIIKCSNVIVQELIKGKTVEEAVNASHIKSADYILKLIYSKEPLAPAILQAIVVNDSCLGYEGSGNAKIA